MAEVLYVPNCERVVTANAWAFLHWLRKARRIDLAGWAAEGEHPPMPDVWPMSPGDPVTEIAAARRSIRWVDWAAAPGPIAAFIRDELGACSSAATPIFVEGRLWGVLAVHSTIAP